MRHQAVALLMATSLLTSCTVGPNYQRPLVQVPQTFRAPEPLRSSQAAPFANLKWWQVFRDEELQDLIKTALEQNYDRRDAVARVEAAQAKLGITRSDQFPQARRRPDIRAAEQNLIAANANIGAAKAAYFPQLSLSGFLGGQSIQLSSLFSGPSSAWSFVPQLTQPIFTAGRLRSNVRLAEAQRDSAVVQYQKAIQTASCGAKQGVL